MGEIDTTFVVKRFHIIAAYTRRWLEEYGRFSAETFLRVMPNSRRRQKSEVYNYSLDDLILNQFETYLEEEILEDEHGNEYSFYTNNFTKKFKKNQWHMNELYERVNAPGTKNLFYDTYPIFVSGESITEAYSNEKLGHDPYSNVHLFSTLFIENIAHHFETELISKIRLIYIQPETWISKPVVKHGDFGVEDVMSDYIYFEINPFIKGIKYGNLEKFDDTTPKIGNSWYKRDIFSFDELDKQLATNPELHAEEFSHTGSGWVEKYQEYKRLEILAAQEIMALRYGNIFKNVFEQTYKKYSEMGFGGIPLFMEKTSPSMEIMKKSFHYTPKYTKNPVTGEPKIIYPGGKYGPLAGLDLPEMGICEPRAIGRLLHMIQDIEMQEKKNYKRTSHKISFVPPKKIEFVSTGKYPWFLLEKGTENRYPNAHTLLDNIFSHNPEDPINQSHKQLIDNFAYVHRIGWSRKEARLAIIFNQNKSIYDGFRAQSKQNLRWFEEFKDKHILTPDKLKNYTKEEKDIFNIPDVLGRDVHVESDFRGSELSLPTSPKFSERFFDDLFEGKANVGCTIEKLIGTMPIENRNAILLKALNYVGSFTKHDFLSYRDPLTFQSIFSMRGTAIHALTTEPYPNLVHYETLEKAGIEPVSSDNYSETTFAKNFTFSGIRSKQTFSTSIHPDVYLFFRKGENTYDIFINDTKTNRVTHYPEHKYLAQTYYYFHVIKTSVEEHLGIKIENLYTSLDKNAFYTGFRGKQNLVIPHKEFRPMQNSPITVFRKGHIMEKAIPQMVGQIMEEKQMLRENSEYFEEYKTKQHDCKNCFKCYDEHKFVCDYLARKIRAGNKIEHALSNTGTIENVKHLI